jgi:uncharacterized membrane protein
MKNKFLKLLPKTTKGKIIAGVLAIVLLLAFLVFLRGWTGEDNWRCNDDGVWERHGNPTAAKPAESCKK